jgi:hypothetical protein
MIFEPDAQDMVDFVRHVKAHAASIMVRARVNDAWGAYPLSEVSVPFALHYLLAWMEDKAAGREVDLIRVNIDAKE